MKIYLGKPKSKFFKELLSTLLFLIVAWGVLYGETLFRHESDLQHTDQLCGSIVKYGYERGGFRGFSTWRLYIVTKGDKEKVYRVGLPYLRNVLDQQDMHKGRDVCVQFVPQSIDWAGNFISQIFLDSSPVLEFKDVLVEYLSAPDKYVKNYLYVLLGLTLLCFIRVE